MDSDLSHIDPKVIQIDDDDDVIDLGNGETTPKDLILEWDAGIRQHFATFSISDNPETLSKLMDDYLTSFFEMVTGFHGEDEDTLEMLRGRAFCHVTAFYSYYMDIPLYKYNNYLRRMDEILRLYCDLEIKLLCIVKHRKVPRNEITVRIIYIVTMYLFQKHKHMLHVFIKMGPTNISPKCIRVLTALYHHFLVNVPMPPINDEVFCRSYILFQKWKQNLITDEREIKKLDSCMNNILKYATNSSKAKEAVKTIISPSSNSSFHIARNLIRKLDISANTYFNYIAESTTYESLIDESVDIYEDAIDDDQITIPIEDNLIDEELQINIAFDELEEAMSKLSKPLATEVVIGTEDDDDEVEYVGYFILPTVDTHSPLSKSPSPTAVAPESKITIPLEEEEMEPTVPIDLTNICVESVITINTNDTVLNTNVSPQRIESPPTIITEIVNEDNTHMDGVISEDQTPEVASDNDIPSRIYTNVIVTPPFDGDIDHYGQSNPHSLETHVEVYGDMSYGFGPTPPTEPESEPSNIYTNIGDGKMFPMTPSERDDIQLPETSVDVLDLMRMSSGQVIESCETIEDSPLEDKIDEIAPKSDIREKSLYDISTISEPIEQPNFMFNIEKQIDTGQQSKPILVKSQPRKLAKSQRKVTINTSSMLKVVNQPRNWQLEKCSPFEAQFDASFNGPITKSYPMNDNLLTSEEHGEMFGHFNAPIRVKPKIDRPLKPCIKNYRSERSKQRKLFLPKLGINSQVKREVWIPNEVHVDEKIHKSPGVDITRLNFLEDKIKDDMRKAQPKVPSDNLQANKPKKMVRVNLKKPETVDPARVDSPTTIKSRPQQKRGAGKFRSYANCCKKTTSPSEKTETLSCDQFMAPLTELNYNANSDNTLNPTMRTQSSTQYLDSEFYNSSTFLQGEFNYNVTSDDTLNPTIKTQHSTQNLDSKFYNSSIFLQGELNCNASSENTLDLTIKTQPSTQNLDSKYYNSSIFSQRELNYNASSDSTLNPTIKTQPSTQNLDSKFYNSSTFSQRELSYNASSDSTLNPTTKTQPSTQNLDSKFYNYPTFSQRELYCNATSKNTLNTPIITLHSPQNLDSEFYNSPTFFQRELNYNGSSDNTLNPTVKTQLSTQNLHSEFYNSPTFFQRELYCNASSGNTLNHTIKTQFNTHNLDSKFCDSPKCFQGELNYNAFSDNTLNPTIKTQSSTQNLDSEFSNSPPFSQGTRQVVEQYLQVTSYEVATASLVNQASSSLQEDSSYYQPINGIQCVVDASESHNLVDSNLMGNSMPLPTAVPDSSVYEENFKIEVSSKINFQYSEEKDSKSDTRLPLKKRKLSVNKNKNNYKNNDNENNINNTNNNDNKNNINNTNNNDNKNNINNTNNNDNKNNINNTNNNNNTDNTNNNNKTKSLSPKRMMGIAEMLFEEKGPRHKTPAERKEMYPTSSNALQSNKSTSTISKLPPDTNYISRYQIISKSPNSPPDSHCFPFSFATIPPNTKHNEWSHQPEKDNFNKRETRAQKRQRRRH